MEIYFKSAHDVIIIVVIKLNGLFICELKEVFTKDNWIIRGVRILNK